MNTQEKIDQLVELLQEEERQRYYTHRGFQLSEKEFMERMEKRFAGKKWESAAELMIDADSVVNEWRDEIEAHYQSFMKGKE